MTKCQKSPKWPKFTKNGQKFENFPCRLVKVMGVKVRLGGRFLHFWIVGRYRTAVGPAGAMLSSPLHIGSPSPPCSARRAQDKAQNFQKVTPAKKFAKV